MGLVEENGILVAYIPAASKALVFRVKSVLNKNYPVFFYGPLPYATGAVLPTFEGGTTSVPAAGVFPARAYEPDGITFPLAGAYDETDMWYTTEEFRDRLFHVIQEVTPGFLRVDAKIPKGVTQNRFQKERMMVGVEKDFGFSRGFFETVHVPRVHYGYRYANDTNLSVWTSVKFTYGEYVIETPKDAEFIFNVLVRRIPSYWLTLPIMVYDSTIKDALQRVYGFEGFPLYAQDKRTEAISEYSRLLKEVVV